MMNRLICALLSLFFVCSCYRVSDQIEPKVDYQVQNQHFANLRSAFTTLKLEEKETDWGKEVVIANGFVSDLDLYRAVSTFKRAEILIGNQSNERKTEIQYSILLCYYLGKHYDDAVESVSKSLLANVDKSFPAYHELLLILHECYHEMQCDEKEERIYEMIQKDFPATAEKLTVSRAVRSGNIPEIRSLIASQEKTECLDSLLCCYEQEKKSVSRAQMLNAVLPGAGYLYLGQKKSAFTAFFLNALFISAAYEFFHNDHLAAGIITSGFEAGWYFGGIYGAGEEAKYYNERVYERNATCLLHQQSLFPVLMMQYAF